MPRMCVRCALVSLIQAWLTFCFLIQPTHLEYIIAAANLHAFNYGLKGESNPSVFKKVLSTVEVPTFVPKQGVKVQVNDAEPVANDEDGAFARSFASCPETAI